MAKLDIITLPDPLLRQTSTPLERVDDETRKLMDDMLETMYAAPGIGLAAIQVAIPKRVIVVDVSDNEDERTPIAMVNPQIVDKSHEMRTHEEGCLSLPDVLVEIDRPKSITVNYLNRDGEQQTLTTDDLLATVIQHEVDHLDGKLIIDFLSRLRRDIVVRKFKKQSRQSA